jgi:hypothetical protein
MVLVKRRSGYTVNASALDTCHVIFFAGETAIKALGFVIYGLVTDNSPFLQEHFIDHPLGGVDDMAVWTARMWNRFATWLEVCVCACVCECA